MRGAAGARTRRAPPFPMCPLFSLAYVWMVACGLGVRGGGRACPPPVPLPAPSPPPPGWSCALRLHHPLLLPPCGSRLPLGGPRLPPSGPRQQLTAPMWPAPLRPATPHGGLEPPPCGSGRPRVARSCPPWEARRPWPLRSPPHATRMSTGPRVDWALRASAHPPWVAQDLASALLAQDRIGPGWLKTASALGGTRSLRPWVAYDLASALGGARPRCGPGWPVEQVGTSPCEAALGGTSPCEAALGGTSP